MFYSLHLSVISTGFFLSWAWGVHGLPFTSQEPVVWLHQFFHSSEMLFSVLLSMFLLMKPNTLLAFWLWLHSELLFVCKPETHSQKWDLGLLSVWHHLPPVHMDLSNTPSYPPQGPISCHVADIGCMKFLGTFLDGLHHRVLKRQPRLVNIFCPFLQSLLCMGQMWIQSYMKCSGHGEGSGQWGLAHISLSGSAL